MLEWQKVPNDQSCMLKHGFPNIKDKYPLFLQLKVFIFFFFLQEKICYGYSLEVPQRGTSNEYPQHYLCLQEKYVVGTNEYPQHMSSCEETVKKNMNLDTTIT